MAETKKKPASRKKKTDEPPGPPTLEEALQWDGWHIDGFGGKSVGRVAGIHVDAESEEPRWVLIRLGRLAGCTAIPIEHVAPGVGRLWAGYEKDWIKEAPRFRPTESLTAIQELELCAHWGIGEKQGRAAEVAGRQADEISAVPADS